MAFKKHEIALKRHKIPLKRHKMALKRHKIAFKRHKIPLKRHKMALKRHKMSPDPDKTIVPGLCNYYKLLILSEQNNAHTPKTMHNGASP